MSEAIRLVKTLPTEEKVGEISVSLIEYEQAAANLLEQATRAEIVDEETYAKGGDLIKVSKLQVKKMEDERKKLVKPFNDLVSFINNAFKPCKAELEKIRKVVEPKMAEWKRKEDQKRREAAEAERKRLEAEALEKAAESKAEDQDRVLDEAAEAGEKIVQESGVGLSRGSYSSTGTRKKYSTNIIIEKEFLLWLVETGQWADVIEWRKVGLNNLAKRMIKEEKKTEVPGATFTESDSISIY